MDEFSGSRQGDVQPPVEDRDGRLIDTDLAPMAPPSIDSALLADPSDNTVLAEYLEDDSKPFTLAIPMWAELVSSPTGGPGDHLTVFHVQTGTLLLDESYDQSHVGLFPLSITRNRAQLREWGDGSNTFSYSVATYNGGGNDSEELTLRFDRVPPYANSAPAAFPAIAAVTDATLDSVKLTLPSYPDREDGDHLYWFWLNEVPEDPASVAPSGSVAVGSLPQTISVPKSVISNLGDGGVFVFYALQDKAGNVSRLSFYTEVGVALGPLPTNLKPPVVPAAADGVVGQQDAFDGVTVEVPAFDHYKPTDQVRVTWGSRVLEWRDIGNTGSFPMVFNIASAILWEHYGAGSSGDVEVDVAYEVRRGTVPQGDQKITVKVNLERIGPVDPGPDPDPEWPDPINPRLPRPKVVGKVSDTDNTLLPDDEYEDARLLLTIDDSLKEGDTLSFYWNNVPVASMDYSLSADDVGAEVERSLPWVSIAEQGNGDIPVYYTVQRAGNPNLAQSGRVVVVVTAIGIHPEAPIYLGGNTSAPVGWLTCAALYDRDNPSPLDPAIRVQVPDLAQYGLKVGDTVTLNWTAVHGFSGETPIRGGVDKHVDITLDASNLNGFVWRVEPYDDHILPIYLHDESALPIRDGRGRTHYTFTLSGKTYQSEIAEQIVSMHDATGPCTLS